jgi:hypothetical protein
MLRLHVEAQLICSLPQTYADAGPPPYPPRWAAFQQVTVTFLRGDYTSKERDAIREIFQEFEVAGQIENCSNVTFYGFTESDFPRPWGNQVNTYYISRVPLTYAALGGTQPRTDAGTPPGIISRAFTVLRSDVTLTSFASPLDQVLRHEIGLRFF